MSKRLTEKQSELIVSNSKDKKVFDYETIPKQIRTYIIKKN